MLILDGPSCHHCHGLVLFFLKKSLTHKEPIHTCDATTGQEIKLKIYCNCAPGDNPAQSETCGHIGGKGNYSCRKCNVGGTQKDKETNAGFHAMFTVSFFKLDIHHSLSAIKFHTFTNICFFKKPGKARSSKETLQLVEEQVHAACLGVAQTVESLQTTTGVKDTFTQYWIENLIERARTLRKAHPGRAPKSIQDELIAWVTANKNIIYNPFLTMKGAYYCQWASAIAVFEHYSFIIY